jgi:NAD(P)H-dependent FMN reductase
MLVVASVRPGRIGLPIARWAAERIAATHPGIEVDLVDLVELGLPFMDEPKHPRLREYTQPHTLAWSARVEAADAFVFVTPEYNYSYAPALKNAIDFLFHEWAEKPYAQVSYGGVSGGTRAAAAFSVVAGALGMLRSRAALEMNFPGTRVLDGAFDPTESEETRLDAIAADLLRLDAALRPLRGA